MPDSLPWVVLDTNVLIDFDRGALLDALFALPLTFVAPDVLIEELLVPDGRQLIDRGLRLMTLTGAEVVDVMDLAARHRAPSINDLFALVLARAMGFALLTGDRVLRQVAESEGVTVHGTLWLLDEGVRLAAITPARAVEGLERMLANGSRLPEPACQARMRRWKSL
ncbi:MAG: hypothetical protein MUQ65_14070 [Armatimonadetes bacterium]|nr:hypothetical protein [Armatimonadota bacterium]